MRILLLCTSFNSLTQRLHVVLREHGHSVGVVFDINEALTRDAVEAFRPDVVLAPFLKRKIPEDICDRVETMVVHPGPPGDGGPNALDWAVLNGEDTWGVSVLRAHRDYDRGDVWAYRSFPMRPASKSAIYREEVGDGAVEAVLEALDRIATGRPPALVPEHFSWRGTVPADLRRVDWEADTAEVALRKVRSADGQPGGKALLFGEDVRIFDGQVEPDATGEPGAVLGRRDPAILVACREGALWVGAVRRTAPAGERPFKAPATLAFARQVADVAPMATQLTAGYQPIRYSEDGPVGMLMFDFYNGAMSVADSRALRDAYLQARARPTSVLVLAGGRSFWSNGIHLGAIEAADSPADASMAHIEAIDDVAEAIITTADKLTISALGASAAAGGVFLALASDIVVARDGIVLNPHYKNMGNLYGSEYWTYVLPRRVGPERVSRVMAARLPMGANEAQGLGLVDKVVSGSRIAFDAEVARFAADLAGASELPERIAEKRKRREADERDKPLASYRAEELKEMSRNFFGFDPSYHVARYNFITKVPHGHTPRHLSR